MNNKNLVDSFWNTSVQDINGRGSKIIKSPLHFDDRVPPSEIIPRSTTHTKDCLSFRSFIAMLKAYIK